MGAGRHGDSTRKPTNERKDEPPGVSIVVPTFRREDEVTRLITSLSNCRYPGDRVEVIVVDDAASLTRDAFPDDGFDRFLLVSNEREKLLSECRNQGLRAASNEYVFFVDDDNVVAEDCLDRLVDRLQSETDVGAVTPFQYYLDEPDRLWSGGTLRNDVTTATTVVSGNEVNPQQRTPMVIDDAPNAFMVRRSVATALGGFDGAEFPIEFEHTDFFARMNAAGYRLESVPDAVVYHDTPRNKTTQYGNETKVYYRSRNRVLLQRRHAPASKFAAFVLLFPGLVAFYVWELYRTGNSDNIPALLRGFLDGLVGGHTDRYHPAAQ